MFFGKNSSSTTSRIVKTLYRKLENTDTASKYLVSHESLQNTIFKVSSATEETNEDSLFKKPVATDRKGNSGDVTKRCSSQTKTEQQRGF